MPLIEKDKSQDSFTFNFFAQHLDYVQMNNHNDMKVQNLSQPMTVGLRLYVRHQSVQPMVIGRSLWNNIKIKKIIQKQRDIYIYSKANVRNQMNKIKKIRKKFAIKTQRDIEGNTQRITKKCEQTEYKLHTESNKLLSNPSNINALIHSLLDDLRSSRIS